MAPRRNHPRPSLQAEALFACLVDPDVAPAHQSAAAVELASRLLGGLIGVDYACQAELGPEALIAALERPEVMPDEHSVAGGLSVPHAVLMALSGLQAGAALAPPGAYALVRCPLVYPPQRCACANWRQCLPCLKRNFVCALGFLYLHYSIFWYSSPS